MKDPTRLLELELHEPDAATELLRAGALEEPPAGAVERLLGALSVPAAAPEEAHLSGVRPALRAAGKSTAKLGARWLVLAGGGMSLIAAAWLAAHSSRPAPQSPAPALQPKAAAPQAVVPPPSAAPEPQATPPRERHARSLAQEIASLDQVRQLIAKGQGSQALAALRRHTHTYAEGALQQEATLLRIEALLQASEPAQARALAARFLKEHPDSPHRERVRALVKQADETP